MFRSVFIIPFFPFALLAQPKVTYDEHVLPIFQQSCLNCHNPDKAKGGLDLSSFTGTLKGGSGGKIAEPGDVGSKLITVVLQTVEPKMPPEGEKLAADKIDVLKRWIEGGLLENANSTARKASKPKFEATPRTDPASKPDGPPPMPVDVLLEPSVVTPKSSAVHALAASPWAPLLAVTGQRQVLLYDTNLLELAGVLPFPEGDPISLAFTPDARYLIVGGGVPGKSGITITFDVTNGQRSLTAGKEFDSVLAADIRPGFDLVATGGPSRLLKIWNTATGDLVKSVKKHTDWITALDLSPDGVLLASGDRNGGVWVWESETGNEFHTLRAHQAAITSAVFRSDSNILATSSEDGTVRFWEMNGGTEVKKLDAHPGGVSALSFSRDGTSLTTGRDSKARLWKPDFNPLRDLAAPLPALPTSCALDADGKRAFVGDVNGHISVFHTEDGKLIGQLTSNPPTIAARLESIQQQLAGHAKKQAELQQHADAKAAELERVRKELADAEAARQQADATLKAAQEAAAKNPDEATKKLAEEAAGRIAPLDQNLKARREALANAEKAGQEAIAARDAGIPLRAPLDASHKRWTAAAINTKLLDARKTGEVSDAETENAQAAFTESARQLEKQSEALNQARDRRQRFARLADGARWSAIASAEHAATLAMLDDQVAAELAAYQKLESAQLQAAAAVDSPSRLAWTKRSEAESLQQAYRKALE